MKTIIGIDDRLNIMLVVIGELCLFALFFMIFENLATQVFDYNKAPFGLWRMN